MVTFRFILKSKIPVPEPSLIAWGRWMETADLRVAETMLGDVRSALGMAMGCRSPIAPARLAPSPPVRILTAFTGLDPRFDGSSPPVLFESQIFGGPHDGDGERYCTWEEAEAGHQRYVVRAKRGLN
jgi:hypothetical protein